MHIAAFTPTVSVVMEAARFAGANEGSQRS